MARSCPPRADPTRVPCAAPPPLTLAKVVRAGLAAFLHAYRLPAAHWKILNALLACRTPALGGHRYRCTQCGREHFVPHSCRNRHCPRCQGAASHEWLQRQQAALLPVPYFHLVFTLPHALNPLIQQNPQTLYDLLFAAATGTLLQFGRNKFGAQVGITAVLHTWSQTLTDHYHLHCIVSGGGLSLDGARWVRSHPRYLFAVPALSEVFQAKFCEGLQRLHARGKLVFHGALQSLAEEVRFQRLVREATAKKWVVYSKRPFAGPEQVLAYLARYTHRVAISERRLLELDPKAGTVSFRYKDYADGARAKIMTLRLEEFVRRFCLHLLPERFVKIRHYGLLANRGRQRRIERARDLLTPGLGPSKASTLMGTAANDSAAVGPVCPHCGQPALVLVEIVPPERREPAVLVLDSS
jgi:hypothetical protein